MSLRVRRGIRGVLMDIDDTITVHGKLPSQTLKSMEEMQKRGLLVVPITGRPAGWVDHIARMWPVDAVVGENGGFYARYSDGKMRVSFEREATQRAIDRSKLTSLGETILRDVPGTALASDQAYRACDLAIDYAEDVPLLPPSEVERIVGHFTAIGAHAKVSSIHVNGWFGDYDKLSTTKRLFRHEFRIDLEADNERYAFFGDSPNDAPMFGFFRNSIGVANIRRFLDTLDAPPRWITRAEAARGFAEGVRFLLNR